MGWKVPGRWSGNRFRPGCGQDCSPRHRALGQRRCGRAFHLPVHIAHGQRGGAPARPLGQGTQRRRRRPDEGRGWVLAPPLARLRIFADRAPGGGNPAPRRPFQAPHELLCWGLPPTRLRHAWNPAHLGPKPGRHGCYDPRAPSISRRRARDLGDVGSKGGHPPDRRGLRSIVGPHKKPRAGVRTSAEIQADVAALPILIFPRSSRRG